MVKKALLLILIPVFLLYLAACEKQVPKGEEENKLIEKVDPIKEQIKAMTLDEKIGQMVIVGFDGYTIGDKSKELIEKYHVGGFILFSENIKNSNQMLNLINSLKETNANNKTPLFMAVDEEGGRVNRMPKEFKKIPSNKKIGEVNSEKFSFKLGAAIGEEIKSFGFNVDFAPVLDINNNPKNLVIGDRSFGADPDLVRKLGIQTMKGIQSQNVISVVKHFPGHGDTSVDSHADLPLINNDLERLKSFELIPFKDAIENNADGVMVAHILLPKIDSENPASLSKAVITDILRGKLNFNGVVITDDMTMGAIMKNYNIEEAALKSINAGSDIILVCHGYNNEVEVINALKKAVGDGTLTDRKSVV